MKRSDGLWHFTHDDIFNFLKLSKLLPPKPKQPKAFLCPVRAVLQFLRCFLSKGNPAKHIAMHWLNKDFTILLQYIFLLFTLTGQNDGLFYSKDSQLINWSIDIAQLFSSWIDNWSIGSTSGSPARREAPTPWKAGWCLTLKDRPFTINIIMKKGWQFVRRLTQRLPSNMRLQYVTTATWSGDGGGPRGRKAQQGGPSPLAARTSEPGQWWWLWSSEKSRVHVERKTSCGS